MNAPVTSLQALLQREAQLRPGRTLTFVGGRTLTNAAAARRGHCASQRASSPPARSKDALSCSCSRTPRISCSPSGSALCRRDPGLAAAPPRGTDRHERERIARTVAAPRGPADRPGRVRDPLRCRSRAAWSSQRSDRPLQPLPEEPGTPPSSSSPRAARAPPARSCSPTRTSSPTSPS